MTAYYSENDLAAAAWIEALIDEGAIMDGVVDTRSIVEVRPSDLKGFTRCHFFAGIATWDLALTLAGWPMDRQVWTGSCPCQPFSNAGKRKGKADERHLWPVFYELIRQCAPDVVAGEQVASKDGRAWFDDVQADLEDSGYAIGAVVTPAAGYGAPHERHRTHFIALADDDDTGQQGRRRVSECSDQRFARTDGVVGGMDNGVGFGWGTSGSGYNKRNDGKQFNAKSSSGGLADDDGGNGSNRDLQRGGQHGQQPQDASVGRLSYMSGPTNGFWRDADWLGCRDDRWRPVESSTFPLAHRAPARVGRLRGYGNAIVAPQAIAFIQSFLESEAAFLRLRGL